MGLAIDGNEVHGIARGGQAFLAMQENSDGSININGNMFTKIPKFNQKNGYDMKAKKDSDNSSQYDLVADLTLTPSYDADAQQMCGKKVIMFLMWHADYFAGYEILVTQPFLFGTPSSTGYAVMDNIKPLIYSDTLAVSNIKLVYNTTQTLTVFGLPEVGSNTDKAYVSFGYQAD